MSPATLVLPTRILVVGGGGREHTPAWKLAAEPGVNAVWVAPGSDAIAPEPRAVRGRGHHSPEGAGDRELRPTRSLPTPAHRP